MDEPLFGPRRAAAGEMRSENYRTMTTLGIKDTILAIGLPYFASAFVIFLRQFVQSFMRAGIN